MIGSHDLRKVFREVLREELSTGDPTKSQPYGGAILTHMNTISANDYEKLNIDLGIARTDEVIASNVHGFRILRRTTDATFELKMIDATKTALNQDDLPDGSGLTEFKPTDLLLTNAAQTGKTLTIVVFKKV